MLKRFVPLEIPNGIRTTFNLPESYAGGDITLFVNGQLLATLNDTSHPFGYTLDETDKTFTFYRAPYTNDTLYIIYDDSGEGTIGGGTGDITFGAGILRLEPGFALISYAGAIKAKWDKVQHTVVYPEDTLANIQNLIIDQIEDRYGVPASEIIREIQTYRDDTGSYRLYIPGVTSPAWTGNGEHIINNELYRDPNTNDYGDPNNLGKVFFNPGVFTLSNCILDDNNNVVSNDLQNPIEDLPMGQRSGMLLTILPTADLSLTNGLLEIYF